MEYLYGELLGICGVYYKTISDTKWGMGPGFFSGKTIGLVKDP